MDALDRGIPRGMGPGGVWSVGAEELRAVLERGAAYAVERGYGTEADLEHTEGRGAVPGADVDEVGPRALARGASQVGSLGSGNHFLEVQVVDAVLDDALAAAFGLHEGQVCVMIHCGSRGLGHQICQDHVARMLGAMARATGSRSPTASSRARRSSPPRGAPTSARWRRPRTTAARTGSCSRTRRARRSRAAPSGGATCTCCYDVSHNLAGLERHEVDGRERLLLRAPQGGDAGAFPPGHPELPERLPIEPGQPVLVPGSMGTASYVLAGAEGNEAFASACHGAGRMMSRHAARRRVRGQELARELEAAGVAVRTRSWRGLAEEAPFAYKDVDEVVRACAGAGLARVVARLVPVGVVKA
ncbi:MAG: RNA-splicing ligase RtcB [Acidimicrobiia bacterium]|nr:MAG: RNA-splicing ligase RtcB [Acidimicrobiia bacterium]